MRLSAQANELDVLRARIAALEAATAALPSSFGRAQTRGNYLQVTQASHGFTVGTVIRHNGTVWVRSQADTAANALVGGLVVAVPHANSFVVALPGSYVTGLTVTAGMNYLSAATAGLLTATPPTLAVPVLMADSTTSGVLVTASPSGGPPPPTEDGTVFCSKSDLSGGEWVALVDIGRSSGTAGKVQILSPNAAGVAVEIDGALVPAAGKKLYIQEEDVCDAGVTKKRLILASAPY